MREQGFGQTHDNSPSGASLGLLDLPVWARHIAGVIDGDERLPCSIENLNLVLNRSRLAAFWHEFADDRDVKDLLALDLLGAAVGLPVSSTGLRESLPSLSFRPFRVWEYTWLYKALRLRPERPKLLDLGGAGSHLILLAGIAGCDVTSIDANPEFVSSAQESASALGIRHFEARVGDMRFLSGIAEGIFDVVVSCSVLEHLTAADQEVALTEIARVLKPGGLVGLTFDFGTAAPGSSKYLPPPHEPPPTAVEAVRRYSAAGLQLVGNDFSEDPVPGSLFHSETVSYTVASLFLTKGPRRAIARPRCERGEGLVTSLSIAGFPFRAYEYSRSLHSLQDESSLQLARRTLDRVRELELIAAERLDSIQEMHRHVDRLRQELAERQRGLETLAAAVAAKDERIASLETTAAERLDSVHQMHAHVDHLRSELARSAQEAGELRAVIEGRRAAIEDLEARLTQSCDRNTVLEQREAALQNKVVRLQNQTVWQVLTRRFKH